MAAVCVTAAVALLSAGGASAGKAKTEECGMDAVSQSICVYRLILDDIDSKVTMRGGGGVTSITQTADDTFEARIAQEGHEDIRTYQIELPETGAPKIMSVKESTKSY
jgi:hypothetical protein